MFAQKLKAVLPLAVLVLGALACAALAATHNPAPQPPPPPKAAPVLVRAEPPAPKAAPKPLPKGPNKLLYWTDGKLTVADPDGKNAKELALKDRRFHPGGGQLSPDGKSFAYLMSEPKPGGPQVQRVLPQLHVRALDGDGNGTDLGVQCESFVWSPDGTEIACSSVSDPPGKQPEMTSFVVNVKSKEKTALKLPADHVVTDWAPNGRFVTTRITGTDQSNAKAQLYLMNRDGTEHKALAPDTNAMIGRLSPDGTRLLCVLLTFQPETQAEKKKREEAGGQRPEPGRELAVLDIGTNKVAKVQDVPQNAELQEGFCWSPDGKRIAYTWRTRHEGKPEDVRDKETESHLIVCDPDGKNAKTVVSATGKGQWEITLAGVHWR